MGRYFGTDGIRDDAGASCFQPPFLDRLAAGLTAFLRECAPREKPIYVVIGRDPRPSGEAIVEALGSRLAEHGVHVFDAGVCPTPAVAKAVIDLDCAAGVVVTASHNPASDNGIKLFQRGGLKFRVEEEARLEDLIDAASPEMVGAGPAVFPYDAIGHYIEFATSSLDQGSLADWRIVVDCANGATRQTTPVVLERLGAEIVTIGMDPDGARINDGCGSEHLDALRARVVAEAADFGLAHDGDGDRLILVDEDGTPVPGDAVLGFVGAALARSGRASAQTVVATIMSNLGLERALARVGGRVERTDVGDRNVLRAMLEGNHDFGGEASGHLIFRRLLPTGDGLLAALQILAILGETEQRLADLVATVPLFPQRLRNLRVREKIPLVAAPEFAAGLEQIRRELGDRGRILVRYSGTEPKLRLLAEAESETLTTSTLAALESLARHCLPVVE